MLAIMVVLAAAPASEDPCVADPDHCFIIADQRALPPITVTASRTPLRLNETGLSISQVELGQLQALNLPLVKDYLTLLPGVAVATTGPMGAQTQVRIRGAEANHSITFIDGIEVNDPASSGEFRLETLLAQGVERIEVLRGAQSALWGSQAIGGVINITTRVPEAGRLLYGEVEGGSFGTVRGGVGGGWAGRQVTVSGQFSGLSARGYDVSRSGGDRDGYENITAHGRVEWRALPELTLLLVGRQVNSQSWFDDFDYGSGVPRDAPFSTRSRQTALRAEAALALLDGHWLSSASFMAIRTANVNLNAGAYENQSDGKRDLLRLQSTALFDGLGAAHRLTAAVDVKNERFVALDDNYGGASNQRQRRRQTGLVGEYRLTLDSGVAAGIAVRHDWNDQFADATTVRVDAVVPLGDVRLYGSYGTGVADPTFYDQFGFFPGFFAGNPALKPERSRSVDAGIGWRNQGNSLDVTLFDATLDDEIVSTFDSVSFLSGVANASGRSRRRGVEVSGTARLAGGLMLNVNYTWLDAGESQAAGTARLREVRRPPHSGSVVLRYQGAHFDLAASAAIVGARGDTDFARFVPVTLPGYVQATLSGAWHVSRRFDITARVENALDARIVDVFAYRGPGVAAYGGMRVRL